MIPEQETNFRRSDLLLTLLLMAAGFLAFARAIPFDFINWDDPKYIHANPWLLTFRWQHVWDLFFEFYFSNYHPLTIISYMVDTHLFGYSASAMRITNLTFHALTVGIIFGIFRTAGLAAPLAAVLVFFFATHPLRVESVVWISERKDVLCGFFYLLALWIWQLESRGYWRARVALPLALLALMLALFSKAMAVTLPLVLIAYDLVFQRQKMKTRAPLYFLMIALCVVFSILNKNAQGDAVIPNVPWGARLGLLLYSPVHYLQTTLVPFNISPIYPMESRPSQHAWGITAGVIVSFGILAALVWSWGRQPLLFFGIMATGISLGPVTGIVPFGSAWAADRYSYIPTVFLLFGVGGAAMGGWQRLPALRQRIVALFAIALISAIYLPITQRATGFWETPINLWGRVEQVFPNHGRAQIMSRVIPGEGVLGEITNLDTLLDRYRENPTLQAALAGMFLTKGEYESAIAIARSMPGREQREAVIFRAFREMGEDGREPMLAEAEAIWATREAGPLPTTTLGHLAFAFARTGQEETAVTVLGLINRPDTNAPLAWGILAENTRNRGDLEAARRFAAEAIALFPAETRSASFLMSDHLENGRLGEAARLARTVANQRTAHSWIRAYAHVVLAFEETRQRNPLPHRIDGHLQAAEALLRGARTGTDSQRADQFNFIGSWAERFGFAEFARDKFLQGLALDGQHAGILENLALHEATNQRFGNALRLLDRALLIDPDDEVLQQNRSLIEEDLRATGVDSI